MTEELHKREWWTFCSLLLLAACLLLGILIGVRL